MRILLFLLDLFFSRSRCFKDEEMNRFSKRGDPIENRRTPDASKRSIQRRRRRRTSSSRRMRKPSFTERQKRKHARSARVKKRFTQLQKYARARERERERERHESKTMIVKKTTTTSHAHPLSHLSARRTTLQTGCSCATGGRWRGFRSLLRRLRRTVSGSTRAG